MDDERFWRFDRMSHYCGKCRYNPKKSLGKDACPFTALYWDFLARNRTKLARNRRMKFPYLNLDRKDPDEIVAIRRRVDVVRIRATGETFL